MRNQLIFAVLCGIAISVMMLMYMKRSELKKQFKPLIQATNFSTKASNTTIVTPSKQHDVKIVTPSKPHDVKIVTPSKQHDVKVTRDPLLTPEDEYYNLAYKLDANCSKSQHLGSLADGGYSICLDPPYTFKKNQCVSMDFGINNEWSFEDDLDKNFGCQIHGFDPSMNVKYTRRGENIRFHPIGLDDRDYVNDKQWKMSTLKSATELIGLKNDAIIDLLKIDIEGSEWASLSKALKDGILKNVKQIIFESHVLFSGFQLMAPQPLEARTAILRSLREAGFHQWKLRENISFPKTPSPQTRKPRTCCIEHHFINKNFK